MEKTSRPAVFLDRDGTLIDDRGWLSTPDQVVFFYDTVPALRRLQAHFALFIVTNQSGVGRGIITMAEVARVNAHITDSLAAAGVRIIETYVCPHDREEGCVCIKPNPYFLHRAEREHAIDLGRSFVIGDHPHDIEFGMRAGARGIYVLTGHGERHRDELRGEETVSVGIGEAADIIMGTMEPSVVKKHLMNPPEFEKVTS